MPYNKNSGTFDNADNIACIVIKTRWISTSKIDVTATSGMLVLCCSLLCLFVAWAWLLL